MNKTKIEWTDYTWNPVTGCWGPGGSAGEPQRCFYCYAQRMAHRLPPSWVPKPFRMGVDPFQPTFYPDRLSQPAKVKKPSKFFTCSMGDLCGDWVPTDCIAAILESGPYKCPQHTFQFLTKNPKRYQEFNPWLSNCWLLTTITNQQDADERIPELLKAEAPVLGVSVEPMLGAIDFGMIPCRHESHYADGCINALTGEWWPALGSISQEYQERIQGECLNWLILGALTGPGSKQHQTKPEWVQSLIDQARAAGVPVFLKSNLNWPEKIQEWPE